MRIFTFIILILNFVTIISNSVNAEEIFRCLKADGTVEYSQSPSADCQIQAIKKRGGKADQAAIDKLRHDKIQAAEQARRSRLEYVQQADKKHAQQDKDEYCQESHKNMDKLSNVSRIFETDAQGNRVRLSEEQRQQRIQQIRMDLTSHCQ